METEESEENLAYAGAASVLLGGAALLPESAGSWPSALLGGLALGAAYFVLFPINPNGMGFGDVKLALPLGVALGWYGWGALFVGAFTGFLLGAAYGLGLVLLCKAGRKSAIPLGPFMVSGALIGSCRRRLRRSRALPCRLYARAYRRAPGPGGGERGPVATGTPRASRPAPSARSRAFVSTRPPAPSEGGHTRTRGDNRAHV